MTACGSAIVLPCVLHTSAQSAHRQHGWCMDLIDPEESVGDDGAPAAAKAPATTAACPELTELSPGLLQLLDLVLQHEHGHCECQQRQKLQLGRHHDSEQPHQIIHIKCLVSSCSGDEEEEVLEEETLDTHSGGGGYKAAACPCMALSPRLCVRLSLNVRVFWF